tara:strand:- start:3981 stop:5834 length:1854 start_codon:yes stop_codon:yes gene_type:complete
MAVRTILNNGSPDNRIDIVILGDGYTSSQLVSDFTTHARSLVDYLFAGGAATEPYGRYASYFNVHLIDIASVQSGADNPGGNLTVDTALDATYFFDGTTERLLYIDDSKADAAVAAALQGTGIDVDMRFASVNDTKYGGGGGKYAVYAGGNANALDVAVHEVAHSYAKLADEYGGNPGVFTGAEPVGVNITKDASGAKWQQWLGYDQPGIGTIAAYQGGGYFDQGIYRPSDSSKMRDLGRPFDAISREQFILKFYEDVDPLDNWTGKGGTLNLKDVASLSVTPISADTISVDWYVDGVLTVASQPVVTVADLKLTAGSHTVSAKAADKTDWVRLDRTSLEQTITWQIELSSNPVIADMKQLFAANPDTAKGLASAYEVLQAGVPNEAGFVFLINSAVSTNFGAGAGVVFNQENIFINLVNNLVQGNADAKVRFDALAIGTTLQEKVASLYNSLIPASKQSADGLAFITRADGLKFYQEVAAERGVAGTDGAAIVSLASLLKIVVTGDYGIGNAVNDLIKAVADGNAAIPASGTTLTPIETADGTAFDADDAAALARLAVPVETRVHYAASSYEAKEMAAPVEISELYVSPYEMHKADFPGSIAIIGQGDGQDGGWAG